MERHRGGEVFVCRINKYCICHQYIECSPLLHGYNSGLYLYTAPARCHYKRCPVIFAPLFWPHYFYANILHNFKGSLNRPIGQASSIYYEYYIALITIFNQFQHYSYWHVEQFGEVFLHGLQFLYTSPHTLKKSFFGSPTDEQSQ